MWKYFYVQWSTSSERTLLCLKTTRLRPLFFFFLIIVVLGGRRMRSWFTDTKRGKKTHSEGNLSQYHFAHHKFHMDLPGSIPCFRDERWRLNAWTMARPLKIKIKLHYIAYEVSVLTPHTTQYVCSRKTNWWMLYKESIAIYMTI